MRNFFLHFGLSKILLTYRELFISFIALLFALLILIFFDVQTLFLATLLISVISIKMINAYIKKDYDAKLILINKVIGLWFALSVAPAFGVQLSEVMLLSNGFLPQALFSFLLFIYFYTKQPSIIKRLKNTDKGGVTIVGADIIAGFAAGISASLLWQIIIRFL